MGIKGSKICPDHDSQQHSLIMTTTFINLGGYCAFVLRSAWVAKLISSVDRACTILAKLVGTVPERALSNGECEGMNPRLVPQRLQVIAPVKSSPSFSNS
jgi:hypothetical protein